MFPVRVWLAAPALRQRSTLLFVAMVVAPALIFWYLIELAESSHSATYDYNRLGWTFAVYVGVAWLIALWLLVRPKLVVWHAALVIVLALVTQVPLAIWLENSLRASTESVLPSIVTVGLPEELAKLLPLAAAVVLTYFAMRPRMRSWWELPPRSYLFLGAISGLAFGCAEQARYLVDVYVPQLLSAPSVAGVYGYTNQVVWRLITDPISHACWAGVTGYFVGIAVQRMHRTGAPTTVAQHWRDVRVALIGLAIAAVLHGLGDYFANGGDEFPWVCVVAISALLFVAYATAGEVVERQLLGTGHQRWSFHVGDLVQLPSGPQGSTGHARQNVHWRKQMDAHLGKSGRVIEVGPEGTARVDADGGSNAWAIEWLRPLLRVGDRVRIPDERQAPSDAGGCMVTWQPEMDALLGKTATVTAVATGTVELSVGPPAQQWAVDWLEREGSAAVPDDTPGPTHAPARGA